MRTKTKTKTRKKRKKRRIGTDAFSSKRSVPGCRILTAPKAAALIVALMVGGQCYGQMQAPVAPPNGPTTTRSIEGSVLDKGGSRVPGAIVLLKDSKTLQVRSYVAQADGTYHFFGLSTDINYELRAQAKGLTSPTKTVSVFDSHKLVKLDLKLKKEVKKASGR